MGLTFIQIPIFIPHLHIDLKICVSSHLNRVLPVGGDWGLLKCWSPQPRMSEYSHLFEFRVKLNHSFPHSRLIFMQVTIIASRLHPGHDIHVSPPSRSHLTEIYSCHPGPISHPPRSHTHLRHISPPSRSRIAPARSYLTPSMSQDMHLTSIHPGPVWPESRYLNSLLTPIYVAFTSHPIKVPRLRFHLHPRRVSPPFRSIKLHLTSIQVTRIASLLHPGYMHLISIMVLSHVQPNIKMFASSPSRSRYAHLSSIQVASFLHPGNENVSSASFRPILPPPMSWDMHLISILVPSHPYPVP